MPMSSVLQGGAPTSALAPGGGSQAGGPGSAPPSAPGATPPAAGGGESAGRGNAVTVIAGVGVLLLAMGIGVLIGRSGANPSAAAAPQVITVSSAPSAGTTPAAESFTGDWPAGSSGYTVQLQALPTASTQVSAVQAAKSAAEGEGAKSVGALKSDEFAGLTAGSYIVYSGRYTKKSEANKALGPLKKNFSEAKVVQVGAGAGASGGKGAGAGASGGSKSGVGSSPSKPAPPTVVESLKGKSGKNYEQESKNLPNVVSTG